MNKEQTHKSTQVTPGQRLLAAVTQHIYEMNVQTIIEELKRKEKSYLETETFSHLPGIYAFFFNGNSFPILGDAVSRHQIIYIGKTESSQEKRDAKTHFSTGKTGSSTVRKSIGSILREKENLTPIPRNEVDYQKGRLSHFKFDDKSEEKITIWMENNLSLSFYEYPKSKYEIELLETNIIDKIVPILNISKNPKNPFKDTLQRMRKDCAEIAASKPNLVKRKVYQNPNYQNYPTFNNMNMSGKYIDLWSKKRAVIAEKMVKATSRQSIQLDASEFDKAGNRKKYSFNLEFYNGSVVNNIGGSAVARDLAKVLENSQEIRKLLGTGYYKFRMDSGFCLWIEKKIINTLGNKPAADHVGLRDSK